MRRRANAFRWWRDAVNLGGRRILDRRASTHPERATAARETWLHYIFDFQPRSALRLRPGLLLVRRGNAGRVRSVGGGLAVWGLGRWGHGACAARTRALGTLGR